MFIWNSIKINQETIKYNTISTTIKVIFKITIWWLLCISVYRKKEIISTNF